MGSVGNALTVRFSKPQMAYLKKLSNNKSCAVSEVIRELVEEKMRQKSASKFSSPELVLPVKIYQLLKEFMRTYHERAEETIQAAKLAAKDIIEALGYPDKF